MAEMTKVAFQLGSSLGSKHLTDAEYIKGGYFTVDTYENLTNTNNYVPATATTDGTIVEGSLCYCTGDSKFYQYDGTAWVEAKLGGGLGDQTVLQVINPTGVETQAATRYYDLKPAPSGQPGYMYWVVNTNTDNNIWSGFEIKEGYRYTAIVEPSDSWGNGHLPMATESVLLTGTTPVESGAGLDNAVASDIFTDVEFIAADGTITTTAIGLDGDPIPVGYGTLSFIAPCSGYAFIQRGDGTDLPSISISETDPNACETGKVIIDGNLEISGEINVGDLELTSVLNLPLQKGSNTGSVQQKPDGDAANGLNFSIQNLKAVELDSELKGLQPYGATGQYSVSFGGKSSAQGKGSVAEGFSTVAKANYSHAEGSSTAALGGFSHAEGAQTTAAGYAAHAEGFRTVAINEYAHSEGYDTTAEGQAAHAEGVNTHAYEKAAHAEGIETWAEEGAHAEGYKTRAESYGSHAEGDNTEAANDAAHAEGNETQAFGPASHAEGHATRAGVRDTDQYGNYIYRGGAYAHAEGDHTVATGQSSHAEGGFVNDPEYGEEFGTARAPKTHIAPDTKSERQIYGPFAAGVAAHAEGIQTLAYGYSSHSEGFQTEANSRVSHAEGSGAISGGYGWRIIGPADANVWKNGTNTITIYDPRKTFLAGDDGVNLPSTDAAKKSAEGYICSIKLNSNYDLCGYIMAIDDSNYDTAQELTITLDVTVKDTVGLTADVGLNDKANDQNTLRVFKGYIRDITAPSETTQHNNAIREVKGGTICVGTGSHAEGLNSMAFALAAHAEGRDTKALGTYSHAEGRSTLAVWGAHSEGQYTYAIGLSSHAEGRATRASGDSSHSEGIYTTAANSGAHAEGSSTQALALYGHAEGQGSKVIATATAAHAEGGSTEANGVYSHTEGYKTRTSGHGAHAEGTGYQKDEAADYPEKSFTDSKGRTYTYIGPWADGRGAHAEGAQTLGWGYASHAEGVQTQALSPGSHAEGFNTTAGKVDGTKIYAHAEGWNTKSQGDAAHAEGKNTLADSEGAHAEGSDGGKTMTNILRPEGTPYSGLVVTGPTAWSRGCHAEGVCTFAASEGSHAEGIQTQAVGYASHAAGIGTRADKQAQTVVGQYNTADNNAKFIVGYGTGMENENRFNCFSTGKNNAGQAYITVGATTLTEGLLRNIFAGTDSPAATMGQDGDIYIQYTN